MDPSVLLLLLTCFGLKKGAKMSKYKELEELANRGNVRKLYEKMRYQGKQQEIENAVRPQSITIV